jgi:hypothetical protein
MKNARTKGTFAALITLLAAAVLAPTSVRAETLSLSLCAPGSNTFTTTINNTYFPLPAGQQWTLAGKEQGERIGFRVSVLGTESFYSGQQRITTRVVEEREWADTNGNGLIDGGEELLEVSLNYFAQTSAGTVCYFGEQVDIYEGGVVVSHEGSWRADSPRNAPGIFMPANPQRGLTFQQEVAPGVAMDEATIAGTGTVKVPAGTFENALRVNEVNTLDGSKGTKFYAPGVGLIRDGPLDLVSTAF